MNVKSLRKYVSVKILAALAVSCVLSGRSEAKYAAAILCLKPSVGYANTYGAHGLMWNSKTKSAAVDAAFVRIASATASSSVTLKSAPHQLWTSNKKGYCSSMRGYTADYLNAGGSFSYGWKTSSSAASNALSKLGAEFSASRSTLTKKNS